MLAEAGARIVPAGARSEAEILNRCSEADALMVVFAPITRNVIAGLKHCQLIVRYGVGVDNIDVAAATERGIPVAYVPDYCLDEVSNHVMMLLLASARKLRPLLGRVASGDTALDNLQPLLRGVGAISGETLGLLGFGKIARMVAQKARAFGLRLLAYDPYVAPAEMEATGVEATDLENLLAGSDYVSCHLPLLPTTRALLNADAFRRMKRNAYFINTSRGGVVDEPALVQALTEGWIAGAALDVVAQEPVRPDNPLAALPNVLLTPHTAYYSDLASRRLRSLAAGEVRRVLDGEPPTPGRCVNPQVYSGSDSHGI